MKVLFIMKALGEFSLNSAKSVNTFTPLIHLAIFQFTESPGTSHNLFTMGRALYSDYQSSMVAVQDGIFKMA